MENLIVRVSGANSAGDLRHGADLDDILATFLSAEVPLTVEARLDRDPESPIVDE